jgi:hypothetical protein
MLKPLDKWELAQCQVMTNQFAKSLKTRKKKTDEADGATDKAGLTFSGQVNFSDTGNDKADFNFDDFNKQAKAETALFTIKSLVARSGVQESIKRFLTQRNEAIKKTKEKQKEKEKEKENKHISHPNWY